MLLKIFQHNKQPLHSAVTSLEMDENHQPPDTYPVLTSKALLAPRIASINRIEELAGIPASYFQQFYISALLHYSQFVQQLPASEAHHHAHAGGLLDHTLEVITTALSLRQGYLLPPGAAAEELVHQKDVWTYAVFTAALCHDLAKPAVDQRVSLYDGRGQPLGLWDPWAGDMNSQPAVHWYELEFIRNRTYRLHEKASLLLVPRILPTCGLSWLANNRQTFSAWCACVSGDFSQADVLAEIISQADRHSVGLNLGADPNPNTATKSQIIPLHDKLVMALRQLIDENTLPLNRNGAAGWRTGTKLWLVSKRVIDSIRLYLTQSGHTGIPTENQRLFDVLQEHQVLEPYQDRAIWRMTVAGEQWAHDFTLLCIPLGKIWPHPEAWPEEFTGSVTLQGSGNNVSDQTQANKVEGAVELTAFQPIDEIDFDHQQDNSTHSPLTRAEQPPRVKPKDSSTPSVPNNQLLDTTTENLGMQFLDWVVAGLQDRTLDYNNPGARVHVVAEGVLIVSPGIFQDFAKRHENATSWESVQKKFLKLGLHERTEGGLNVHKYRISGSNKSALIMALLLKDTGVLFKTGTPLPNPHVNRAV